MNFTLWILNRIKRSLFGDGQWEWIMAYRKLILREKPVSFLLTTLCGFIWFMVWGLLTVWLVKDKELGFTIMQGVVLSVPAFYIYNWIAALYEIYNNEITATWNTLKDQP